MADHFDSGGKPYPLFTYPALADGKKYPAVVFVHGNAGLVAPYGDEIQKFAKDIASLHYFTAVMSYYDDNLSHFEDTTPHVQTLTDAVKEIKKRPGVDPNRIGLVGFSLGAATAMTYIADNSTGTVGALADFYGFLTPDISKGVAKFPPTIIFHNKNDNIVPVQNSDQLNKLLPAGTPHQFVGPYDEIWSPSPLIPANHAFKPGGKADEDSRKKTAEWFQKHLPPTGK